MMNLIGVLTKVLVLEAAFLLLALIKISFMVINKARKNINSKHEFMSFIKAEISNKISVEKEYGAVYKTIIVLYGVIKLTAMWLFTILASVILNFGLVQIIFIMLVEIGFIGISVNNKLAINKEDCINYQWLENKIDKTLQKNNKDITVKSIVANVKVKIKKRYENK